MISRLLLLVLLVLQLLTVVGAHVVGKMDGQDVAPCAAFWEAEEEPCEREGDTDDSLPLVDSDRREALSPMEPMREVDHPPRGTFLLSSISPNAP